MVKDPLEFSTAEVNFLLGKCMRGTDCEGVRVRVLDEVAACYEQGRKGQGAGSLRGVLLHDDHFRRLAQRLGGRNCSAPLELTMVANLVNFAGIARDPRQLHEVNRFCRKISHQ